jgi:hypothetical protein
MNSEPKHIGQPSVDAQMLTKRLKKMSAGDTVTYEELAKVIGTKPGDAKFKAYLRTARNAVQRDAGLVFEPMSGDDRGVGLKCLTDSEKVELPSVALRRIRRTATKTARKVATSDYDKLNPEGQRKFNTGLSMLGFIGEAAKPKRVEQLESAVASERKRIDFSGTLALFAK